nr:GMP synthase [Chitinophagaceae bacterium]
TGMSVYLQTDEKRKTVIENHGQEKLDNMLRQLKDPDKIELTSSIVLPNFLNQSIAIEATTC